MSGEDIVRAKVRPRRSVGRGPSPIEDFASLLFVMLGAAVRVRAFAFRRSLWLDESSLALNITRRSYRGLLKPLSLAQAAPVGWLWLERTAVRLLGSNEYTLRTLPLICGLLALPLFWVVARRLLPRGTVPFAVGLFVTSTYVVYYSNEAKPYESDLFIGLLLITLALPLLGRRVQARALVIWGLVGALCVWLSNTGALVFGSLSGALVLYHLAGHRRREAVQIVAATVAFLLSFGLDYVVSLRAASRDPQLLGFWASGFLPRPATPSNTLHWLWARWSAFVRDPLAMWGAVVVALLAVVGLAALARRKPGPALLLGTSFVPFFAAACLRKYPFSERLVLILAPFGLLIIVSAMTIGPRWWRLAVLSFIAGTLTVTTVTAAQRLVDPQQVEEIRPVLAFVKAHMGSGDLVLVENFARPPFAFYGSLVGLTQDGTFELRRGAPGPCDDGLALGSLVGRHRFWLIFGKRLNLVRTDQERDLARFDAFANRLVSVSRHGSAAFLYDPRVTDHANTAGLAPRPPSDCMNVAPGPLPL